MAPPTPSKMKKTSKKVLGPNYLAPWFFGRPTTWTALHVDNAMNATSGIFPPPKSGIYFFSFFGTNDAGSDFVHPTLYLNGNRIATGNRNYNYGTVILQSTLQLNMGDKASMQFWLISSSRYQHFIWWLNCPLYPLYWLAPPRRSFLLNPSH